MPTTPAQPDPDELARIRERAADYIKPEHIDLWFATPVEFLGHATPLEVIAGGKARLIWEMFEMVDHGVFG